MDIKTFEKASQENYRGFGQCEICGEYTSLWVNTNGKAMCDMCNLGYCNSVANNDPEDAI